MGSFEGFHPEGFDGKVDFAFGDMLFQPEKNKWEFTIPHKMEAANQTAGGDSSLLLVGIALGVA